MYDHRKEVQFHQDLAASLRDEAMRVRARADGAIAILERQAASEEAQAQHIHRLCTAGSVVR